MNNRKKFIPVISAILLMVTFISNISFASNFIDTTEDTIIESKAITEMTEKDFLNLKEELLLENVSEEQANNLIVKLKNGEIWDSMKKEFSDIQPQIIDDNYEKTIYPDGSFTIVELKDITPETNTMAINKVRKHLVAVNRGIINSSFCIDYEVNTSTKKARITSLYNSKVVVIGGHKNLKTGYWNDWRTQTHGWLSFDYNLGIGDIAFSGNCWLKGYVHGNGNTWTDHSY